MRVVLEAPRCGAKVTESSVHEPFVSEQRSFDKRCFSAKHVSVESAGSEKEALSFMEK